MRPYKPPCATCDGLGCEEGAGRTCDPVVGPQARLMTLVSLSDALKTRHTVHQTICRILATLPLPERDEGLREAYRAGLGPAELGRMVGLSRSRVNQILNEEER